MVDLELRFPFLLRSAWEETLLESGVGDEGG